MWSNRLVLIQVKLKSHLLVPILCGSGEVLPNPGQLFLVYTKLLRAVLASKIAVGVLRKTLRMSEKGDFPSHQQDYRQCQQTPCIGFLNKEQRREHHGIVPVVYATSATTFVFQKPSLEWAEKQDADDVAHRINCA